MFTSVGWTFMFIYYKYIARSGPDVKESTSNTDLSSVPEFRRFPWRRAWQPTPVFLPGESPWQKSLAGYNPWSHKELIMTEQIGVEMQGWIVILCLSFWGTEEFLRWLLHFTVSAAMYKSSNFSVSSLSQELWALQLVIFFWDFL